MQINSVSNFKHNKNTAFKGLWGNSKIFNSSKDEDIFCKTQYTYYPFADETDKEINFAVKNNTSCFIYRIPKGNDWKLRQETYETSVNVEEKLPFTQQDFVDFITGHSAKKQKTIIKTHITEKNLSEKIH